MGFEFTVTGTPGSIAHFAPTGAFDPAAVLGLVPAGDPFVDTVVGGVGATVPDFFIPPPTASGFYEITIVPEPTALLYLGAVGLMAFGYRRLRS